jgi:hypothetical protein
MEDSRPVDLNDDATGAVKHASEVADVFDGELVLLNVPDQTLYRQPRKTGWPPDAVGDLPADLPYQGVALTGDPACTACRYADFIDASMLLLTPSRERNWTGIWRRPVTAEIPGLMDLLVYVANLPPLGKDYRFECRRVICVLNLDGTDDPIIDSPAAVASRTGAQIELLSVLPKVSEGLLAMGIAQTDRPLSKAVASDRIRALGATLCDSSTSLIAVGPLRKNIVSAAKSVR